MKEQIEKIRQEYEEISTELNSPDIFSDAKKMGELGKRQAELSETMENINELERIEKSMTENAVIINSNEEDPEMKQMAMEENVTLSAKKAILEKELEKTFLPKDPNDHKNVIVEIRAGAGGDEAALFAAKNASVYVRFVLE